MEKKEKVAVGMTFEPTGETIKNGFNKVWGGHEFTEYEISMLLSGKEVKVQTENDKIIIGRLEKGVYKGKKYWGFMIGIPEDTAGHQWTDDERKALYEGEGLLIHDFYSPKKCENFTASAFWDDKDRQIILVFDDVEYDEK